MFELLQWIGRLIRPPREEGGNSPGNPPEDAQRLSLAGYHRPAPVREPLELSIRSPRITNPLRRARDTRELHPGDLPFDPSWRREGK